MRYSDRIGQSSTILLGTQTQSSSQKLDSRPSETERHSTKSGAIFSNISKNKSVISGSIDTSTSRFLYSNGGSGRKTSGQVLPKLAESSGNPFSVVNKSQTDIPSSVSLNPHGRDKGLSKSIVNPQDSLAFQHASGSKAAVRSQSPDGGLSAYKPGEERSPKDASVFSNVPEEAIVELRNLGDGAESTVTWRRRSENIR
ncbi:MAG: hypothetical protein ACTJLL_02050 [Anaplasma sp.]